MDKLMLIGIIAVILICYLGFHLHFLVSLIIGIVSIPVLMMIFGGILEDHDDKRRK
jgi:hypothetical protein